jgi:hypothetical protein
LALIPDTHEAYISWKQFEEIQQTMTNNAHLGDRSAPPGAGWLCLPGWCDVLVVAAS